ncbi:MAG: hypothetical protein HY890_00610, partial [Deltaproteobacteria bacterium]|nr:hypothetical protein [Deltaproteobacteria bacterium]
MTRARSPQAKGRVERLFRTLQDRPVKVLRLKGISSKDAANRFPESCLDAHDKRFGVEASKAVDAHRPVAKGLDLDGAPCLKHTSALRNGFTVVNEKRLYQVQTRVNAKSVIAEENVDGRMVIKHKGESSRFEEITSRPKRPKTPIIYKT